MGIAFNGTVCDIPIPNNILHAYRQPSDLNRFVVGLIMSF